jgi:SdrD B-like domain
LVGDEVHYLVAHQDGAATFDIPKTLSANTTQHPQHMKKHPAKSLILIFLALYAFFLPSISVFGQQGCSIPTIAEQNALNPRIYYQVFANPPISYGKIFLWNVPTGFSIANGIPYQGWCIDSYALVSNGGTYFPLIYNSLDNAALIAGGITTANWDKVNYIINHKPVGATASDIQVAIWHYIGGGGPSDIQLRNGPGDGGFVQANAAVVAAIIAAADNNAGFVPGPGELVSIVLDVPVSLNGLHPSGLRYQPFIIEVPCPIPGSIGDTVFCDFNENGVQNTGEPGIPNVEVKLLNAAGTVLKTTSTDANGMYLFTGLPAAVYNVMVNTATLPPDCNKVLLICPTSKAVNLGAVQN